MKYLGLSDLLERWIYTRRGLEKLMTSDEFPAASFAINRGRNRVWNEADIRAYEITHPEMTSEAAKLKKVIGYAKANAAKRRNR